MKFVLIAPFADIGTSWGRGDAVRRRLPPPIAWGGVSSQESQGRPAPLARASVELSRKVARDYGLAR